LALSRLDDAAGAERAFQAGLSAGAKTDDLRVDYARFLVAQKRPVEALQRLNEVVQQNARHTTAWRLGGEIALSQPAFLEFARDWTAEAVRQLPDEKPVLAQRAEALLLSQEISPARPLWEQACNGSRAPQALAAIILCATLEARTAPRLQNATEEVAVSRAFLDWYRRLVAFEARDTVLQVNHRLGVLGETLPSAARLLESVRDEASREEPVVAHAP
jgi:Tfp pilus assembly protein PilF